MHLPDALVSPVVAGAAIVVSSLLIAVAVRKVSRDENRSRITSLMGVMGAFVFAAQAVDFTIPGTGTGGHIIGGVLLAAVVGPWAAFLTLTAVLVVQCLLFADGGLLALGCNIINIAAVPCLVAFPLIYSPLAKRMKTSGGMIAVSVIACIVSSELGAAAMVMDTTLSGVTSLPTGTFLFIMLLTYLVVGVIEGLATYAVVKLVARYKGHIVADVG